MEALVPEPFDVILMPAEVSKPLALSTILMLPAEPMVVVTFPVPRVSEPPVIVAFGVMTVPVKEPVVAITVPVKEPVLAMTVPVKVPVVAITVPVKVPVLAMTVPVKVPVVAMTVPVKVPVVAVMLPVRTTLVAVKTPVAAFRVKLPLVPVIATPTASVPVVIEPASMLAMTKPETVV